MRRQSRRSFLKRAGCLGAASALARVLREPSAAYADYSPTTVPALGSRPSTGPIDESAKSIVADIRAEQVFDGQKLHERLLGEMVELGLQIVTGSATASDAWNKLLGGDEVIGLKFNHVGAGKIETTIPLARQLVQSLGRAGFAPERIVLIEVPGHLEAALQTKRRVFGWSGGKVHFGSGREELAAVLEEITAIVNVPFLKTHNIAGMTGCLKNLSHALVRRPGRYHAHACTPYVGDIVALPQICLKLRVHIVNAVRAVFTGGPAARLAGMWPHRGILVSKDPVAADSVGLDIIDEQRSRAGLAPIGDANAHVPHVSHAARRGLGTDDQDYIRLVRPQVL